MSPFLAAMFAVALFATPLTFLVWLLGWKPAHALRLISRGALLVDVGSPEEYAEQHLEGAVNLPSYELALRQNELGDHRQPIITYARSRLRSAQAAQTLKGIGFHEVFNMGTLKGAMPDFEAVT
jgi:phage shock protein E